MLAGLVFFFAFSISAFAQEVEIPAQWQDVLDEAPISSQEFQQTSLSDWLEILFGSILENAVRPFQLMAKLCALMIAAALARAFCGQESTEGAQIIDMVTALSVFVLCAASLSGLFEVLQEAMKTVQSYLASFIPVFASVLTACGQVGSAAIYTGLFFGGVNLIVAVVCAAGFPITQVSMALSAISAGQYRAGGGACGVGCAGQRNRRNAGDERQHWICFDCGDCCGVFSDYSTMPVI